MNKIFKTKAKTGAVATSAPEEQETDEEIKVIEQLSGEKAPEGINDYREIPVCMTQESINNLVIENNMMLKQILSEMD